MSRIREYSHNTHHITRITNYVSCIMLSVFIILAITGCEVERPKPPIDVNKLNWGLEHSIALEKAKEVYQQANSQALDLSNGPCLSNYLHGNIDYPQTVWVLDIAHNPRQAVDDLPENQCSAYRDGQAMNFIEFDEQGNLIKYYSPWLE